MSALSFTAYIRPEPQGSAKAFIVGGRARITSANSKLKPFRSEVTRCALAELAEQNIAAPLFPKTLPVRLRLQCVLRKPDSVSKHRLHPVVKPDLDKIVRGILDSLTGVVYHDDAQVVAIECAKAYGPVECVHVWADNA